jgi:hypothetical protein
MNDDLERQLSQALSRKDAPEGFAERVHLLAVAASNREPLRLTLWERLTGPGRLRWATALAALVLIAGGAGTAGELEKSADRERIEGEAAKARLQLALRITSQKLRQIQERVQGVPGETPQ